MSSATAETTDTACANCGKEESNEVKLKQCTDCYMVKYCNSDCQIAHRSKHQEACKKRSEELLDAVKEIFDGELFKDHPEREECPICMLPLPFDDHNIAFRECCGKLICHGCTHHQLKEDTKNGKQLYDCGTCAFCRTPLAKSGKEYIDRLNSGVKRNDANSMHVLGIHYREGDTVKKDLTKAMVLFREASKLGCAGAYYNWGSLTWDVATQNEDKLNAIHCFNFGAIGGNLDARRIVANLEANIGNYERAYKHYLLGAKAGDEQCLKKVKTGFVEGYVTKDEYAGALRAYQKQHDETKSALRDEAVADWANHTNGLQRMNM